MNIKITIKLTNMPEDTDIEHVNYTIRRQVAEWLDLDQHPEDMHVHVREEE